MRKISSPGSSKKFPNLSAVWNRLTAPRSSDPDQARQEYLTRVVLVIMEGVLLSVTILILAGWIAGMFPFGALSSIVFIDVLIAGCWRLTDLSRWKIVRFVPVALFFTLGVYTTWANGLQSFLTVYVIAIVLAAFLLGARAQWFLVALSIVVHIGVGWYRDPRPFVHVFSYFVTIAGTLTGIALLQWLATDQLHRALAAARALAAGLQVEIAERKRVEQALKISEEKYRMLVENQGEGVVFVDSEETFTFANPASESIFGLSSGELVGRNLREFTNPDVFNQILEQTERRRAGEKSSYELEIRRPDGEIRTLLVTATPLFRNGGEFTGAFGVLMDITDRKRAEAALKRYAQGMAALYDTALEIDAQIELPTLLKAIVQRAAGLVGTSMASLFLMNSNGDKLELVISQPQGDNQYTLRLGEGLVGRVAQTGAPLCVDNSLLSEDKLHYLGGAQDVEVGRALGVPLRQGGKVIGVLTVQDRRPGVFSEEEIKLIGLFADQAALAIDKARLYAEIQRLAMIDEVTGLFNRRGLWEFGRREFERARRFDRPLAAIFLDIDHFKRINDTFGHAIGDQVLHIIGERLKSNAREVDLVARYGGEEFVILLPEVDTLMAAQVAERLRRSAVDMPILTDQGPVVISLSLGVAQIQNKIHDLAMLIDLADQAMFQAKQKGRNRVEILGGT